jgi:oligopeptide/dipeptide ABC transporter ATP-binding protein
MTSEVLVEVHELRKSFSRQGLPFFGKADVLNAVDGVSLEIHQGETLGLVGESGSGKSTLGRVILNLTPANSGKVIFSGRDITSAQGSELRRLRRRMQIVFQDPYASLNPRMSVGDTIREGLRAGGLAQSEPREKRLLELVDAVGLGKNHISVFPHQLSGGQRQRVAIARALSVSPAFVVADEPVSALDLSIQAQILNLLADLQAQFGLTYLLISHDLNVIRYLSDRVAVMYRGRIVEQARASDLFDDPRHPYTQLLFSALPKFRADVERKPPGGKSEPSNVSSVSTAGCAFARRCPWVGDICLTSAPALENWKADHRVACFKAAGVNQCDFRGQNSGGTECR